MGTRCWVYTIYEADVCSVKLRSILLQCDILPTYVFVIPFPMENVCFYPEKYKRNLRLFPRVTTKCKLNRSIRNRTVPTHRNAN